MTIVSRTKIMIKVEIIVLAKIMRRVKSRLGIGSTIMSLTRMN